MPRPKISGTVEVQSIRYVAGHTHELASRNHPRKEDNLTHMRTFASCPAAVHVVQMCRANKRVSSEVAQSRVKKVVLQIIARQAPRI